MENIVRRGEIACYKQFLLFSQCFLPLIALMFHFTCTLKMSPAICFNLDQSEILSFGNGSHWLPVPIPNIHTDHGFQ